MKLFLYKALLIGLIGAFIGYFLGLGIGSIWGGLFSASLFNIYQLVMVMLFAPLLSLLAAYIPATIAARQDPAEVLKEE